MYLFTAVRLLLVLALSWCSVPSLAVGFDSAFDEKSWAEIEVQLPAFPEAEKLIPFRVGYHADIRYLIDGNSLSVGADGVLRYTLVVISPSGVKNISYEGLRCATAERRRYAFGRSDNTWSKARGNQWVRLEGGSNNHHVALFTDYFCAVGASEILSADDARRVLRSGGQPAGAP